MSVSEIVKCIKNMDEFWFRMCKALWQNASRVMQTTWEYLILTRPFFSIFHGVGWGEKRKLHTIWNNFRLEVNISVFNVIKFWNSFSSKLVLIIMIIIIKKLFTYPMLCTPRLQNWCIFHVHLHIFFTICKHFLQIFFFYIKIQR